MACFGVYSWIKECWTLSLARKKVPCRKVRLAAPSSELGVGVVG